MCGWDLEWRGTELHEAGSPNLNASAEVTTVHCGREHITVPRLISRLKGRLAGLR